MNSAEEPISERAAIRRYLEGIRNREKENIKDKLSNIQNRGIWSTFNEKNPRRKENSRGEGRNI